MPRPQPDSTGRTRVLRTAAGGVEVEVVRSTRRRRTVSAYREGDRTIVLVPARMTAADEQHWVDTMVARLAAKDTRRPPSDADLLRRAEQLSRRHLGGRARPASVRWVGNMRSRWGSATPADRTIRLSDRLREMPDWVVDYVLVHELAHLLVADHSERFWALVAAYPRAEVARGYLLGVVNARAADPEDEAVDDLAGQDAADALAGHDAAEPLAAVIDLTEGAAGRHPGPGQSRATARPGAAGSPSAGSPTAATLW